MKEASMSGYRRDCFMLGVFLTVTLLMREAAEGLSPIIYSAAAGAGSVLRYGMLLGYSALCLQIIPSFLAAFMLKYSLKNFAGGFRPPKNTNKALANFPAIYGAGMTVNILTLAAIYLITGGGSINDSVNPITSVQPPDMPSAVILFIMLTVIAPVFEEFIFRGAVLNLLKPYGNGIAILISAFTFGIFHGNVQQCLFAFVIGIALGYISCATNSIFCTTIIHALINSVSGIILLFYSCESVQLSAVSPEAALTDGQQLVVTLFYIFMIIVLLTAVIGFIAMIGKLRHIKKYRIPKVWSEVSNKRKLFTMIISVPVIVSILLMIDVMGPNFIANGIEQLIMR